jgi:ribosome recycling factor
MEKDVQDITDKYCKEIDEMVVIKEKELMAV